MQLSRILLSLGGAIGAFFLLAAPVSGVVIVNGTGAGNITSPTAANNAGAFDFTNFSYWNNIGSLDNATAIYLGNKTVLTVAHISTGNVLLNNGTTLTYAGPSVQLNDPINGQPADLRLFKVNESPALPSVSIAAASPVVNQQLLMTGNGWDRNPNTNYWQVTGTTWNDQGTNSAGANRSGFKTNSPPFNATTPTQHIRWGTNLVSDLTTLDTGSNTRVFFSEFSNDNTATPFEAQAVDKDSGGSVFTPSGSTWQLSGLVEGVGVDTNRPAATFTAVYGEGTGMIDLSLYANQISAFVPEPGTLIAAPAVMSLLLRRRRQSR